MKKLSLFIRILFAAALTAPFTLSAQISGTTTPDQGAIPPEVKGTSDPFITHN